MTKDLVLTRSVLGSFGAAVAALALAAAGAGVSYAASPPQAASFSPAESRSEGRILIPDDTTDSSQTFQNPDGTVTTELDSGPVRFQESDGDWTKIDTSLVERDGRWVPKAAPIEISFSPGGDQEFVQVERNGGDSVSLGWVDELPEPTVDGATLTYRNAVDGGDLVVTALPNGFSHSIVLRDRPEAGTPLEIPIPVALDGTRIAEATDGALRISSSEDEALRAPAPRMWDADLGADGLPASTEPVEVSVERSGSSATLTLEPDAGFLEDPDTAFPVTVDPTYTTVDPTDNGDTFIDNGSFTEGTATWGWDTLRSGTQNSGATVARTYLDFPTIDLANKALVSATLKARVVGSPSCTNGTTVASRITSAWHLSTDTNDSGRLRWAKQPTIDTSYEPQYWLPHGGPAGSACAAHGWATWNVLPSVTAWQSGGPASQYGFQLRAATTTANGSFRQFRSVNGTTSGDTYWPRLIVTYNTPPSTPTDLTIDPSVGTVVGSVTPTISARISDPDTGNVQAIVSITEGAEEIWSNTSEPAAGPRTASVEIPYGVLEVGHEYTVHVRASDGSLTSAGEAGAAFTVQPERPEDEEQPKVDIVELDEGIEESPPDQKLIDDLETISDVVSETAADESTGGAWVDDESGNVVVGITDPTVEPDVSIALDAADVNNVAFAQVDHSQATLDDIVENVYDQPGLEDISSAMHDYEHNQVVLTSSEPVTDELRESVFAAYGDAAVIDSEPLVVDPVRREADTSPFYAGAWIGNGVFNTALCTAAWSWVMPSGAARMLTAGHCFPTGPSGGWNDATTNATKTYNYALGRAVSSTYKDGSGTAGADGDLALLDTNIGAGGAATHRSAAPRMWTGGSSSDTSTTVVGVDRWTAKGTAVCYSGMKRGVQCGRTVDSDGNGGYVVADASASYKSSDGEKVSHVARATKGWGKCPQPGDSGSPVYVNTPGPGVAAHGIVSGATFGHNFGGDDEFVGKYEPLSHCELFFTEIGQAYQHWAGHIETTG
ncbi:hypothetical protein [Marmoricola sp. RAF53]|uniref:hypothetical protein n=1 Tax=Marmoricola sp. RAF53 TaxID=3233059 RepID=UPI003F97C286